VAKEPYPGMDEGKVFKELDYGYQMSCPGGCTVRLYDIMKECWGEYPNYKPWRRWTKDTNDRPSFETLQQKLIKLQ